MSDTDGAAGKHRWERQIGETTTAYAAFCAFRDAGSKRSLRTAYRQRTGKEQAKASGQWTGWYERHDWRERAEAYDASVEQKQRAEREQSQSAQLEQFRERQRNLSIMTHSVAVRMANRIMRTLDFMEGKPTANGEKLLEPMQLATWTRTVAYVAQASSAGEAQSLAVGDLLELLSGKNG